MKLLSWLKYLVPTFSVGPGGGGIMPIDAYLVDGVWAVDSDVLATVNIPSGSWPPGFRPTNIQITVVSTVADANGGAMVDGATGITSVAYVIGTTVFNVSLTYAGYDISTIYIFRSYDYVMTVDIAASSGSFWTNKVQVFETDYS